MSDTAQHTPTAQTHLNEKAARLFEAHDRMVKSFEKSEDAGGLR